MRQARLVVLVAAAWAVCGGVLAAQERGGLLVGVDTGLLLDSPRTGENEFHLLPPFASYFLTERLRLDLAPRLGVSWSDDGTSYDLGLEPGLRYYYFLGKDRKFRLNGGFTLGFDFIERRASALDPAAGKRAEDLFDYRLIPLELEYWHGERNAFTLGLEYGGTVYDGPSDRVGPGVTVGYRWRIK